MLGLEDTLLSGAFQRVSVYSVQKPEVRPKCDGFFALQHPLTAPTTPEYPMQKRAKGETDATSLWMLYCWRTRQSMGGGATEPGERQMEETVLGYSVPILYLIRAMNV